MIRMKKAYSFNRAVLLVAIVGGLTITISSCSPQQNQAYLIYHPSELNNILTNCNDDISKQSDAIDPECIQAKEAYIDLVNMVSHFQANGQEGFGQMIMAAEIHLSQLYRQLRQVQGDQRFDIFRQIDQQWIVIQSMWAVIAAIESHSADLRQLFQSHPPASLMPEQQVKPSNPEAPSP